MKTQSDWQRFVVPAYFIDTYRNKPTVFTFSVKATRTFERLLTFPPGSPLTVRTETDWKVTKCNPVLKRVGLESTFDKRSSLVLRPAQNALSHLCLVLDTRPSNATLTEVPHRNTYHGTSREPTSLHHAPNDPDVAPHGHTSPQGTSSPHGEFKEKTSASSFR